MKKRARENSFEAGMETLNTLADRLESGELGLDESLKAFEEGVRLYRQLQEQLDSAKLRIQTIAAETTADMTEKSQGDEPDGF